MQSEYSCAEASKRKAEAAAAVAVTVGAVAAPSARIIVKIIHRPVIKNNE